MSRRLVAASALALGLIGCSSDPEPRPLGTEQFYRRDDRGGALPANPRAVPAPADGSAGSRDFSPPVDSNAAVKPPAAPSTADLKAASDTVRPLMPTTLLSESAAAPSTQPAFQVGQYVPVGAIIAEVNGTPIYADDVVRSIAPLLAARAKELDAAQFRNLAATEINRQVDDMVRAEVIFANAQRNTSPEEKQLAEKLTESWRERLKTENKGSIEEVRRRFRDQGQTYDEAAKEEYRRNLVGVFVVKKLQPRVQVTADDLRRYYDKNRDTLFTQRETLTFRLVKITPQAVGSDAAAKAKVDDLAARAAAGEDFATIAGQINNDPLLLKAKGLVGPVDRGAFRIEAVENALWALNPGEVTPVINANGAYYLGKLEGKTKGRVQAFDEDQVQRKMIQTLRGEQLDRMQQEYQVQLLRDAVRLRNDETFSTTLSMAMLNYPKWRQ